MIILGLLLFVLCTGLGLFVGWALGNDSSYSRVREFHLAFGHPVRETPGLASIADATLRVRLIQEELDELRVAIVNNDIVAIADALGDLDYVVNGAALVYGINLPDVTAEIHNSNMTKLGPDGKPILREDGKILKGSNYRPPQLEPILGL